MGSLAPFNENTDDGRRILSSSPCKEYHPPWKRTSVPAQEQRPGESEAQGVREKMVTWLVRKPLALPCAPVAGEAVRLTDKLKDMPFACEPIQQGGRHNFIPKNAVPVEPCASLS
jgi:hypothetical protein